MTSVLTQTHEARAQTLEALRIDALASFAVQGVPTGRHESWRYTSLEPLRTLNLTSSVDLTEALLERARKLLKTLPELGPRVVLMNGFYAPELSSALATLGNLSLTPLVAGAPMTLPQGFAEVAPFAERSFTALNLGRFDQGVWIDAKPGDASILEVIQLTVASDTSVTAPRLFVNLQEGSALTLVETHLADVPSLCLANGVTEVVVHPRARFIHSRRLCGHAHLHLLNQTAVRLHREATLTSHLLATDGALNRDELHVTLAGPGAHVTALGLALGLGQAHLDQQSVFHHTAPHTTSEQLYKGIYADTASGVFSGKVIVAQEAQKTDAKQNNRNLLLNPQATAYTRPQLEIYADDVKCAHGATVGQLDPLQLFYLRSRGFNPDQARALLTQAFAVDVLQRITTPSLLSHWQTDVDRWLGTATGDNR